MALVLREQHRDRRDVVGVLERVQGELERLAPEESLPLGEGDPSPIAHERPPTPQRTYEIALPASTALTSSASAGRARSAGRRG